MSIDVISAAKANIERFRKAIIVKGKPLGQKPLAQRAGIGETAVRDFVKFGEDIKLGQLAKIAHALEVHPCQLLLADTDVFISEEALSEVLGIALNDVLDVPLPEGEIQRIAGVVRRASRRILAAKEPTSDNDHVRWLTIGLLDEDTPSRPQPEA